MNWKERALSLVICVLVVTLALTISVYGYISGWFENLPAHYDLRQEWPECPSLRMIWDQGRCGSCWAFASAMAMSDRLCIQSNGVVKSILSPQDILTCCKYCSDPPGGCEGGYEDNAWVYWHITGVVTGGSYVSNDGCQPYTFAPCKPDHNPCHEEGNRPESTPVCKKKCSDSYQIAYEDDKFFGLEPKYFDDEFGIMKEIYKNGPVTASMEVYKDFEKYGGGVYVKNSDDFTILHVVRLIGWGEEDGTRYWIGVNMWNDFWGENGFFRIRRGTNETGIESYVMAADPDFERSPHHMPK